jgi:hypothetical protein
VAGQVTLPAVGSVSKTTLYVGGAGAAVLMGYLWWRKKRTPVTPSTVDTSGADTSGVGGLASGGGGGGMSAIADSSLPQVGTPTSNPQWSALVMQQLAGSNADPNALATALGLYLTGGAVTHDQELLIDEAIAVAGYPPVSGPTGYPPAIHSQPATGQTNPPPAPAPTPTPAPTPGPTPAPAHRTFTVKPWPLPGSSLWSIALIEYGDGSRWPVIYDANRSLIGSNPNLIRTGMVLTIP